MIKEIKGHTGPIWTIVHNAENAFHPMKLEVGQVMTTSQPFVERFENEELMVERLIDLTGSDKLWTDTQIDYSEEETDI